MSEDAGDDPLKPYLEDRGRLLARASPSSALSTHRRHHSRTSVVAPSRHSDTTETR